MKSKTPVLLIIDVQKGFNNPKWGQRNNHDAEKIVGRLLEYWRSNKLPVIHIQHASANEASPLHPDRPGFEIMDIAKPRQDEPVIRKDVNSAFIGTELESMLRNQGYDTLVLAGLTTNHCVSTTTRMAGNLGFETYLAEDATAAFGLTDQDDNYYPAKEVHKISLANLHREFATVLSSEEITDLIQRNLSDA